MCVLSCIYPFATPWTAPTRLLCPWDSPGRNNGVCCQFLLSGFSPVQGHTHLSCISCIGRQILYQLHHLGSPEMEFIALLCSIGPSMDCNSWILFKSLTQQISEIGVTTVFLFSQPFSGLAVDCSPLGHSQFCSRLSMEKKRLFSKTLHHPLLLPTISYQGLASS